MDKARIASALSLLVQTKSFASATKRILLVIEEWPEWPMLFGGAQEPYNALVEVGLANREALDRLFGLAYSKRRLVPQAKRADYQRQLMAERRERIALAIQLEELVRGIKMNLAQREKYKKDVQARWMHERNQYIAKKGSLTWKERNQAANEFWATVDAQLSKDLEEARKVLDRPPVKRKRVVAVERPKPVTAMSKALEKAKAKKR